MSDDNAIPATIVGLEGGSSIAVKETPSQIDQACWSFDNANRETRIDLDKKRFIHLIPFDHPATDKKEMEWDELIFVRPRSIVSMQRTTAIKDPPGAPSPESLPWG